MFINFQLPVMAAATFSGAGIMIGGVTAAAMLQVAEPSMDIRTTDYVLLVGAISTGIVSILTAVATLRAQMRGNQKADVQIAKTEEVIKQGVQINTMVDGNLSEVKAQVLKANQEANMREAVLQEEIRTMRTLIEGLKDRRLEDAQRQIPLMAQPMLVSPATVIEPKEKA